MKSLKSITAIILAIVSFTAVASDSTGSYSTGSLKKAIVAPAFNWGSPADMNEKTVEALKYLPIVAPAMEWGSAEDLHEADLEVLKVRENVYLKQPKFDWGSVEDLDTQSLAILKTHAHTIRMPEMVIGNPAEIDARDLK